MKCYLCNKKGKIKLQKDRYVCEECFCRLIERRIRKYIRLNKVFKKGDRIFVIGELNKFFVSSIIKELPVKIYFREKEDKGFVKNKKINKIVVQETADDKANRYLEGLFLGKRHKKDKKHISFLSVITDREAKLFAEIKKLRFKENKKNKEIQAFIDELEKKIPGAKQRLIRNFIMLNRLTHIN